MIRRKSFFHKRLSHIEVNNIQDYDIEEIADFIPAVKEETSETKYYEEQSTDEVENQINQQQVFQTRDDFSDELNALVPPAKSYGNVLKSSSNARPYGSVGLQKKPDTFATAKEPAACWEFSVYNRCARGDRCTFSHKTEHCSKFLEEIMSKGADRLKAMKDK